MSEAEMIVKLLTGLPAVGTNVLLLAALIIVFINWRKDQAQWNSTLLGMITRYEALLEKNAQVLTSLESKIE